MKYLKNEIRKMIKEALFLEHRTKPVLSNIPEEFHENINDLIEAGEIEMAKSLIDSLDGPSDYVDNYREYNEVGDLEKLGNEYRKIKKSMPDDVEEFITHPNYRRLQSIDSEALRLSNEKDKRHFPSEFDSHDLDVYGDWAYESGYPNEMHYFDRYFPNRDGKTLPLDMDGEENSDDEFYLVEHITKPDLSGVPEEHHDKIHDLINKGEIEMAQSLIDAFEGPSNYVDNYISYEEVGDLEKLGNKAHDMFYGNDDEHHSLQSRRHPYMTVDGFDALDINDVDVEAQQLAKKKDGGKLKMKRDGNFYRYNTNRNKPRWKDHGVFLDDLIKENKAESLVNEPDNKNKVKKEDNDDNLSRGALYRKRYYGRY